MKKRTHEYIEYRICENCTYILYICKPYELVNWKRDNAYMIYDIHIYIKYSSSSYTHNSL